MDTQPNHIEVFERLFLARKRFERFALLYVPDASEVQDILMESYAYMCIKVFFVFTKSEYIPILRCIQSRSMKAWTFRCFP